MASKPDDNPFARSSPWPRLPQRPLSVRSLPAVTPLPPEESVTTFTPLFVRPMDGPPTAPLATGGGIPRAPHQPVPMRSIEPAGLTGSVPEPAVEVPSEAGVEVSAPGLVASVARKPLPRRSRLPAVAATLVGIAGVLGLAVLLSPGQQTSKALSSVSVALPTAEPTPQPAPTPVADAAGPNGPTVRAGPRAVVRPLSVSGTRAPVQVQSDASAAMSEELDAPVLSLPAAAPVQTFNTPRVDDPAAPVVTRDPNS